MSRVSALRVSALVVLALMTAGCATASAQAPPTVDADPTVALDADAAVDLLEAQDPVVVDVRTPQEYEAGHLEGAVLLDVQSAEFEARLAELDPAATTLVYCRTGNRSAAAVERMRELGFVDVHDAGGLDDLTAAGARLAD